MVNLDCKALPSTVSSRTHQWQSWFRAFSSFVELEPFTIHLLEAYSTSVSSIGGQTTTVAQLLFNLGKISNLSFFQTMLCLMKILLGWSQWTLNPWKWLSIYQVMLKWMLVFKLVFVRCFFDSLIWWKWMLYLWCVLFADSNDMMVFHFWANKFFTILEMMKVYCSFKP